MKTVYIEAVIPGIGRQSGRSLVVVAGTLSLGGLHERTRTLPAPDVNQHEILKALVNAEPSYMLRVSITEHPVNM